MIDLPQQHHPDPASLSPAEHRALLFTLAGWTPERLEALRRKALQRRRQLRHVRREDPKDDE